MTENLVRLSCQVERVDAGRVASTENLWIDMPRLPIMPRDDDAEPFLTMVLMPAMAEGRSIKVAGAVSARLLSNLDEFGDLWHNLLPGSFQPVELGVSDLLPNSDLPADREAVAAFSGGVDSTFTVWRHTQNLAGHRTVKLRYAAMMDGFDIPLKHREAFEIAYRDAEAVLRTVDLTLLPIRTNFRELFRENFALYQGAALSACLQLFKKVCGVGLVASTRPYVNYFMPWGTNPLSDPLLSTAGFEIQHDGSGFSRIEKVVAISEWKAGCDRLRVCLKAAFQGDTKRLNCGKCHKCKRTILEFQTSGLPIPAAFDGPLPIRKILDFRIHHSVIWYTEGLLENARRRKNPPGLILALAASLLVSKLVIQLKKILGGLGFFKNPQGLLRF